MTFVGAKCHPSQLVCLSHAVAVSMMMVWKIHASHAIQQNKEKNVQKRNLFWY